MKDGTNLLTSAIRGMSSTVDKKLNDVLVKYDRIAPAYDFWDIIPERLLYSSWRRQQWNMVPIGRILEIGVGTGKNIRYYPSGAHVTAIDISSKMLERASKRATTRQDVSIELLIMDVTSLSFGADVFDVVVGSFVLTVLPDPLPALEAIKRVCKPGGTLLLLEFTRSTKEPVAFFQDLVTPFTRAVYRASVNRDITGFVETAGFLTITTKEVGDGIAKIIRAVVP